MKPPVIFIDFETYSDVDISLGPTAYVNGKDFRVVSVAWAVGSGRIQYALGPANNAPYNALMSLRSSAKPGTLFVAHNADFDRAVFGKVFRGSFEWIDTAALCRYYSVPASLDGAAAYFGLGQKLDAGKTILKKLREGAPLERVEKKALEQYNKQDVNLLRKLYNVLTKPGSMDPYAVKMHGMINRMNQSPILVNQPRAQSLYACILQEKDKARKAAARAFGTYGKDKSPVAASADQVKKYLAAHGYPVDSIAEKDLEDFLAERGAKLPKDCLNLISFYREIQSRGADKLRLIVENKLSRIYDSSIFYGTHTGRPAGGGINLLNVKRAGFGDDSLHCADSIRRILKTGKRGERVKRLSSLLWACLSPDPRQFMVRSDLSAIEPRVGAWIRDDLQTLEIYRAADAGAGKDEYTIFGDAMGFPAEISRNLSKIVILAACYGMGPDRLRAQIRSYGMPDPGEAEAGRILDGYHRRNPSVKRVWFNLIKAAVGVLETGAFCKVHNIGFSRVVLGGKTGLAVALPSGRVKHYADCRVETAGTKGWKTFSYLEPRKGFRTTARPGGFYENLVQAVAFDVSVEKALAIQPFASVKLIIHDELNVSAPGGRVSRIEKIMRASVPWLPGMPVNSKTVVCTSFHKGDKVK
jgi:hypothetical protein